MKYSVGDKVYIIPYEVYGEIIDIDEDWVRPYEVKFVTLQGTASELFDDNEIRHSKEEEVVEEYNDISEIADNLGDLFYKLKDISDDKNDVKLEHALLDLKHTILWLREVEK